jgi:hypothetical protein
MDVDTALSEVPVNVAALIDDTDFKTREESVVYNQAGMDLVWNFITTAGAFTQTAVTPTTAGVHDWTSQGNGMYSLEIPASGGTINNDTEGFGWFTGFATGILPWRGPIIGFRAAGLNNALVDSAYSATQGLAGTHLDAAVSSRLAPTVAARTLDVSTGGEAGLDWNNIGTPTATVNLSGTTIGTLTALSTAAILSIWNQLTSALTTVGTIGKLLVDNINATISSRSTFDPTTDTVANVTTVATTTTNTDMRGTDGALTDKAGFSLSATGLDAIVSTATGMVEIAIAVWDRVLTGATHNIARSAGRRLRTLQDFGVYEGGFVYLDTVNGTSGTVDFENGTVALPCLTIDEALTIKASVGLPGIRIIAGSSVTLPSSVAGFVIEGSGYTLVLNGQSVDGTLFRGAINGVSGTFVGTPIFEFCTINNITGSSATFETCGFNGTVTANAAGDWFAHHPWGKAAGSAISLTFDFGAAVLDTALNIRNGSLGIELLNMGAAGTDNASIEGNGQIVYNASCVGGSVSRRGMWRVTDNAGGAVTETPDDNTTNISETLTDTGTTLPALITARTLLAAEYAQMPVQGVALANIPFLLVAASDHVTPVTLATGLSITRSIDGGAFAPGTGAISEVGNGNYAYDASAADMNGGIITFRLTATGGTPGAPDDRFVTIVTNGGV